KQDRVLNRGRKASRSRTRNGPCGRKRAGAVWGSAEEVGVMLGPEPVVVRVRCEEESGATGAERFRTRSPSRCRSVETSLCQSGERSKDARQATACPAGQ